MLGRTTFLLLGLLLVARPLRADPIHDAVVAHDILRVRQMILEHPELASARNDKGELIPLDVKAGDRILFGKWSGTEVKLGGEELLIMKESDIMGIVDGTTTAKKATSTKAGSTTTKAATSSAKGSGTSAAKKPAVKKR